ncbi:hypothetical protein WJX77_006130 [Trebouxia sp. C0004]
MNLFRPSQRRFDLKQADSSQPAPSSRRLSSTHLPNLRLYKSARQRSVKVNTGDGRHEKQENIESQSKAG